MNKIIPNGERDRVKANIVTLAVAAVFLAIVVYINQISAFFSNVFSILGPFLVGAIFTFVLLPISKRLEIFLKKYVIKKASDSVVRGVSAGICMVILIVMIVGFFLILLPQVIRSVNSLVGVLTNFVNNNEATINDFLIKNGFITVESSELNSIWDNLLTTATQYINVVLPNLLSLSNFVYKFIFHLFVGLIITCHFLISKKKNSLKWKRACYAVLNKDSAESLINWARKGTALFGGFISGKIIDSIIIGVICYVFMLIAQLEYAVLISVIIGVTNILPFFGPFIGAIPSIFILLMVNPMHGLIFAIFILVLQQVDGNIIGPKILGDHVGISSLWTMFAIILGSGLFGFVGILLSVPVFALFYAIINAVFEVRLKRKNMPTDYETYEDIP